MHPQLAAIEMLFAKWLGTKVTLEDNGVQITAYFWKDRIYLPTQGETKMKKKIILAIVLYSSVHACANPPILVNPQTGQYLGNLSSNKYDANSTSNEYGRYGSQYSQDSINNPYGQYGSVYSNDSANNPYADNAPAIVSPGYGYGY